MKRSGLVQRLLRGTRWSWVQERHRPLLPENLDATVMDWQSSDRHHAKQGRSTARFRFDGPSQSLSVFLKRHDHLPWTARIAALLAPSGKFSPGAAEWAHLERVRALGIAVPEVVAVGERIGPWGRLQSFLMVAELVGCDELNVALPHLAERLEPAEFARFKRSLIAEMAAMVATLHRDHLFHKDLYLCHFFLKPGAEPGRRLTLIDLHRLGRHPILGFRWRWKDLGQLLFSTIGVAGIDDRDRLRFWSQYRKALALPRPRSQRTAIVSKAARYQAHNRGTEAPHETRAELLPG